ncbi:hypothetical protein MSG28_004390 [Choristoneura fumiferana]|uniref:Uncharacterized protein n=1 Tax=Choristoneura fumiferana TaxID=7141 RepID=A0ACC0KJR6_CHOFU|nr:hypothetical protein MSG28_004390 [Choristoneura fumiferana]
MVTFVPESSSFPDSVYPSSGGWRRRAARRARALCSAKTLRRRVPLLAWLPDYSLRSGLADCIAGQYTRNTLYPTRRLPARAAARVAAGLLAPQRAGRLHRRSVHPQHSVSHKTLRRRVPLLAWLPDYSLRSGWPTASPVSTPATLCIPQDASRRVPLLAWLPDYSLRSGLADCIAGQYTRNTLYPTRRLPARAAARVAAGLLAPQRAGRLHRRSVHPQHSVSHKTLRRRVTASPVSTPEDPCRLVSLLSWLLSYSQRTVLLRS